MELGDSSKSGPTSLVLPILTNGQPELLVSPDCQFSVSAHELMFRTAEGCDSVNSGLKGTVR